MEYKNLEIPKELLGIKIKFKPTEEYAELDSNSVIYFLEQVYDLGYEYNLHNEGGVSLAVSSKVFMYLQEWVQRATQGHSPVDTSLIELYIFGMKIIKEPSLEIGEAILAYIDNR